MVAPFGVLADPLLTFVQGTGELIFDVDLGVRPDSEDDSTVAGNRLKDFSNLQEVLGPRRGTKTPRFFYLDLKDTAVHLPGRFRIRQPH